MFKILADSAIPWLHKLFASHGEIARYSGRQIDRPQLAETDILLTRSTVKITADLLKNTSVKFVGSATVGCDHVNQTELQELGIKFVHAPGCNTNAVAEYVVCAIAWHEKQRMICFDDNLTAAVIGCGRVGRQVKQKLEILGFDVLVNDPPLQLSSSKNWNFVDLEQALQADVVCMHTPLTMEGEFSTYHLIDKPELKQINSNAILINAGRGKVINNAALLEVLNQNPNLSVVLDVWENEPNIDQKLLSKVNLATPHIAGHSWRGKVMGTVMIYRQACEFFGWQPQKISEDDFRVDIPNLKLTDELSLCDVVAQCYDIEKDTRVLRECAARLHDSQVGKCFDEFRKNYYQRPEFSDLEIMLLNNESNELIKSLGFNI